MTHHVAVSRSGRHRAAQRLVLAVIAASTAAQIACSAQTEDLGSLGTQLGSDTGSGSGGGSGSGSGPTGGGGDPTGGGGGPPGGGGDDIHVPTDAIGGGLTLVYAGHAQYELPAWQTLPRVQVVDQLMVASFVQQDFTGPITSRGATLFLHVVGDPFVDTYVFSFSPGVPGDPNSFQDPSGIWFQRSGGAPSQAGPPYTGRPEIIMSQAASTSWTPLTGWAVPQLFIPNGWPPANAFETSIPDGSPPSPSLRAAIASSVSMGGAGQAAADLLKYSLTALVSAGTALYGTAAIGLMAGGPECAPATMACGAAVITSELTFVAAYVAMQGIVSGNQALQAVGGVAALGTTVLATWSQQVRRILASVVTAVSTCYGAGVTICRAEADHFCALVSVPSQLICAQDNRLVAFNIVGAAYAVGILWGGAFAVFGWMLGN